MATEQPSAHLQDSICYLCITNAEFLKLARNTVPYKLFASDIVQLVIRACFKFYDIAHSSPNDHICEAVTDEAHTLSEEKRTLVFSYLDRIASMREPNFDFVVQKLSKFIKTREFENAAVEFVRLVERQDFTAAESLMYGALRTGIERENIGCDYFKDLSTLLRTPEHTYLMPTGIAQLDLIRKFKRKELLCVMGGYKGKKSWTGQHIGKIALMQGLNVLHVSHENTQEQVEQRYDRMFGSLFRAEDEGKERPFFTVDCEGRVASVMQKRPSVLDIAACKRARKTMERFGGRLIIRKYPMGQCDMYQLESYLDYLEVYERFVPDVIINDYPDIMKPMDPRKITRDQINETYIYHKRIADERSALVVVFSQAGRAAIRAKRLTMKDFAEDIRKLANVDTALALCQTDLQAEASLATMFVVAARDGLMDVGCGVVMNLDYGQPFTGSFPVRVGKDAVQVDGEDADAGGSEKPESSRPYRNS